MRPFQLHRTQSHVSTLLAGLSSMFQETVLSSFSNQTINHPCYDHVQVGPNWNSVTFPAILELPPGMNLYLSKGNPSELHSFTWCIAVPKQGSSSSSRKLLITLFSKIDYNSGMVVNILLEHNSNNLSNDKED